MGWTPVFDDIAYAEKIVKKGVVFDRLEWKEDENIISPGVGGGFWVTKCDGVEESVTKGAP